MKRQAGRKRPITTGGYNAGKWNTRPQVRSSQPAPLAKRAIDAPCHGSSARDIEENEAIKDRSLSGVQERPETLRKMILKVSNGHLPAGYKGRVAREESHC